MYVYIHVCVCVRAWMCTYMHVCLTLLPFSLCPALSVSVIGAMQFQSSRETVEGEQEQFLFLLAECIRVLIEGRSQRDVTLPTRG